MGNLKLDYVLMEKEHIEKSLNRIAMEIIEKEELSQLILIGIMRRGVPIAQRIAKKISSFAGREVPVGTMEIKFYTDDLQLISEMPVVKNIDLPEDISGKTLILVDDVIFTGRTTWAAIEKLFELGRPGAIKLLNLVDRGHRELPMLSDYNGTVITTTDEQVVKVHLEEIDGIDKVEVLKKET